MSIRQDVLDAKLMDKFRAALTPDMIDSLVAATRELLQGLHDATPGEITALIEERQVVEPELSNLVEFVAKGAPSSPRLRDEIRAREQRLGELDQRLERLRAKATPAPVAIDRAGSRSDCSR